MAPSFMAIGDAAHVVNLVNTTIFAFAVIRGSTLFDSVWQKSGFCISNEDVPYWTSHDLCLYADTILAGILGVVFLALRNKPGMSTANEMIKYNILGIIGHGIGHGAAAKGIRDGVATGGAAQFEYIMTLSFFDIVFKQLLPFLAFWCMLLRSAMRKSPLPLVLIMSVMSLVCGAFVPLQFQFTYVQTVLMIAFSVNELLRPSSEKGFEYALYPVVVGVPVGIVGWIESIACTKGVMDIGGHLIYDAYIPISSTFFYLTCWARENQKQPKQKVV